MKTFKVGGYVRDTLLGLQPKDVDYVVVGSTPEEMESLGFKKVGAHFPVFLSDDGEEYALARTERKVGHGYNGFETDFSDKVTLKDDCYRRDLTINSMALTLDESELIDYYGGRDDINAKVLRHVSEAFKDDPVRVLRLARFHARYGPEWRVADETIELCRDLSASGELSYLTRERVLSEFERALAEQYPHLFFSTLRTCGALEIIFPELNEVEPELLDWSLVNYHSNSKCMNYAKISTLLSHASNFEKRLNISTDMRKFANIFKKASMLSNLHPVEILHDIDAFRQKDLFLSVMHEAAMAGLAVDFLKEAYDVTKHVSFDTLSESVRATASGKQISEAIKTQRMFAYHSHQNKK